MSLGRSVESPHWNSQEEAKKESAAAEEVIRKAREKRALDACFVEIVGMGKLPPIDG